MAVMTLHLFLRFINKFGTHVIVGVKMGGKDVIYLKQQHSSPLLSTDVQKRLKVMADKRFLDANGQSELESEQIFPSGKVCNLFGCFPFNYAIVQLQQIITLNSCIGYISCQV